MGKDIKHCGECKYLNYVDSEGLGYCDLLEECDVCVNDEACVEFIEDTNINEPFKSNENVE